MDDKQEDQEGDSAEVVLEFDESESPAQRMEREEVIWYCKMVDYIIKHQGVDFFEELSLYDQGRLLHHLNKFKGKRFPKDGSWLLDLLK